MNSIDFCNASYGFREYELEEVFTSCKEIGITDVEIDAGWLLEESRNKIDLDASPEEIEALLKLAKEHDVRVAALGAGAGVALHGDTIDDNSDEIIRAIDLADALGSPVIRVFTEHDFNHSKHYVLHTDQVTDTLYDVLGVAFNTIGKYAQEKDVLVGIENHGGSSATGASLRKLLDMVPFESVGVTFDPANFAIAGEDPYHALRLLEDRIVYTHWKDIHHTDKGLGYCAFGNGEIDWNPIISRILDKYDGLWAIEFERKDDSTIETLKSGTLQSMDNLRSIIEDAKN
jgi:sugar phosphate isomerase/epimerase